MKIKVKVSYGQCDKCGNVAEYYFGEFGSEEPCVECDASPADIAKISISRA